MANMDKIKMNDVIIKRNSAEGAKEINDFASQVFAIGKKY